MNKKSLPPSILRTGVGCSFGSFGEIVQGRLSDGTDFLVTLPIHLWNRCIISSTRIDGPLVVECAYEKTRALVFLVLEELGIKSGFHVSIELNREIPVGKGLSSSTADMLAALRAMVTVFGISVTPEYISRLFHLVEPHDALHYPSSVLYNHRKGILLDSFGFIPQFQIIGVDFGGEVNTVHYNRSLSFPNEVLIKYDDLLGRLRHAFSARNLQHIADCATESAKLQMERLDLGFVYESLQRVQELGAMGTLLTHSGTCVGFLYSTDLSPSELARRRDQIRDIFKLNVIETRSIVSMN